MNSDQPAPKLQLPVVWRPAANTIYHMDALQFTRQIAPGSVQTVVTSPPYWGLRDYGADGQWGLEASIQEHIERMVELFRAIRVALHDTGTVWLNYGDAYNSTSNEVGRHDSRSDSTYGARMNGNRQTIKLNTGLKPKDLIGMPWRIALALQADGWYLRSDIIWAKCLSGGTRVYAKTQKGEMPMTIKDMVRLNPSTVQLWNGHKWTQVVGWSETPRPDEPLEIELRSGEKLACTPNHVWPTARGNVQASELQVGDVICSAGLPEPDKPLTPSYIPDDLGWFIGLFIAEGSYGKGGDVIQISGHVKELGRFQRLCELTEQYGGTCSMHNTYGKAASIHIYSRILSGILSEYITGNGAKTKHLSSKAWQRSNVFLRNVLDGYLHGDGHWDVGNKRWRLGFTRNYNLAEDLRTLCARLGLQLRLKLSVSTMGDRAFPSFRGEIRLDRSTHLNAKPDMEIVRIGRSNARKFWDIAVEDEPHLFALASGVLTHNSNPMPESVTDRPTKAHEYIFLLSKQPRYFYDADAIREPHAEPWRSGKKEQRNSGGNGTSQTVGFSKKSGGFEEYWSGVREYNPLGRNKRTVWEVATHAYPDAHFATFPPALIEPCILAGCAHEVCAACGAPYERVVEREFESLSSKRTNTTGQDFEHGWAGTTNGYTSVTTKGFTPTCECNAGTRPGIVYDPFMGSGTTALVATKHGRQYMGCDVNADYVAMAEKRLAQPTEVDMFTSMGIAV